MHNKALKIRCRVLGGNQKDVIASLLNIGLLEYGHDKHDEALEKDKEALAVFTQRALGVDNQKNARACGHQLLSVAKSEGLFGALAGAAESVRESAQI
jgi:hypothetical protein